MTTTLAVGIWFSAVPSFYDRSHLLSCSAGEQPTSQARRSSTGLAAPLWDSYTSVKSVSVTDLPIRKATLLPSNFARPPAAHSRQAHIFMVRGAQPGITFPLLPHTRESAGRIHVRRRGKCTPDAGVPSSVQRAPDRLVPHHDTANRLATADQGIERERPQTGADVSKRLESVKHLLWHGN